MSKIIIFADFFYGKRRPALHYFLNHREYPAYFIWNKKINDNQEHAIIQLDVELEMNNILKIKMLDKTDDDLIINGTQIVDHFVAIRNLEIDEIRLDHVLYKVGQFEHCMPEDWVSMMAEKNIKIDPIYKCCTEFRLNGTYSMNFSLPVWKWCVDLSI